MSACLSMDPGDVRTVNTWSWDLRLFALHTAKLLSCWPTQPVLHSWYGNSHSIDDRTPTWWSGEFFIPDICLSRWCNSIQSYMAGQIDMPQNQSAISLKVRIWLTQVRLVIGRKSLDLFISVQLYSFFLLASSRQDGLYCSEIRPDLLTLARDGLLSRSWQQKHKTQMRKCLTENENCSFCTALALLSG